MAENSFIEDVFKRLQTMDLRLFNDAQAWRALTDEEKLAQLRKVAETIVGEKVAVYKEDGGLLLKLRCAARARVKFYSIDKKLVTQNAISITDVGNAKVSPIVHLFSVIHESVHVLQIIKPELFQFDNKTLEEIKLYNKFLLLNAKASLLDKGKNEFFENYSDSLEKLNYYLRADEQHAYLVEAQLMLKLEPFLNNKKVLHQIYKTQAWFLKKMYDMVRKTDAIPSCQNFIDIKKRMVKKDILQSVSLDLINEEKGYEILSAIFDGEEPKLNHEMEDTYKKLDLAVKVGLLKTGREPEQPSACINSPNKLDLIDKMYQTPVSREEFGAEVLRNSGQAKMTLRKKLTAITLRER